MHTAMKRFLSVFLLASLFLIPAACGTAESPSAQVTSSPSPPAIIRDTSPAAPQNSVPPTTPEPAPSADPEPAYPLYEFGLPLEESEPVEDDSFFDSAVFLGDSRTEGLQLFSGMKHGDFYWARGMTVFRADDDNYRIFDMDGEMLTLLGILGKKSYESVYIMIGVNELGYAVEQYKTGLADLIDGVIAAQPDAVIYLQTLPPVNDAIARQNGLADYINNDQVTQFNEAVVQVAKEKRVVLLNTAEVYRDGDGQLIADIASDGCHFTVGGYSRWADYLRCHVMDAGRYHYARAQAEMGDAE